MGRGLSVQLQVDVIQSIFGTRVLMIKRPRICEKQEVLEDGKERVRYLHIKNIVSQRVRSGDNEEHSGSYYGTIGYVLPQGKSA